MDIKDYIRNKEGLSEQVKVLIQNYWEYIFFSEDQRKVKSKLISPFNTKERVDETIKTVR